MSSQYSGDVVILRMTSTAPALLASQRWKVDFVGCGAAYSSMNSPQTSQPGAFLSQKSLLDPSFSPKEGENHGTAYGCDWDVFGIIGIRYWFKNLAVVSTEWWTLTDRFNGLLFRIKAISVGPVLNVRSFRFLRLLITARCAYWAGSQLAQRKKRRCNRHIAK